MDDAKKIIDEAGKEGLQMSQGLLRLVLKMWDSAREDVQAATAAARRLRLVSVLAAVLAAVCLCVCIYQGTVIHRQGGEIAAIHRILEEGVVIEETTTTTGTTTTQTVDVDTLHEQAVRLIQVQRSEGKEIPAGMQAVWDWEHSHMMDRVARIKVLLETARR